VIPTIAIHPFGNQATARGEFVAFGPMALRPGIATGLPFRGCKAAGLRQAHAPLVRFLGREPVQWSKDEKHASQTEKSAPKGHFFYPNETYVRLPSSQILSLRECEAVSQNVRPLMHTL
jgi:hypothetical protein